MKKLLLMIVAVCFSAVGFAQSGDVEKKDRGEAKEQLQTVAKDAKKDQQKKQLQGEQRIPSDMQGESKGVRSELID